MQKTKNLKKTRTDRNEAAKEKLRDEQRMKLGPNVFLNERKSNGELLHANAKKLWRYFRDNPDPVLDVVRQINALCHEVRHHKRVASKCLVQSREDSVLEVTVRDKFGNLLNRNELYSQYIIESQLVFDTLSLVRKLLVHKLMTMIDKDVMTGNKYDVYVSQVELVIKELGYDLFPEMLELMPPL